MELFVLDEEIPTLFIKARSYPDDIADTWRLLHEKIPPDQGRRFFGISRENVDHSIQYLAAAEKLNEAETRNTGLESYTIPKGQYRSQRIRNYSKDLTEFGRVFAEMLKDPALDTDGFCLEIYEGNEDAICLVKLDPAKLI